GTGAGRTKGQSKVVAAAETGVILYRNENVAGGKRGEHSSELPHAHVLAGEQPAENGIGDARVFSVLAGAFDATRAIGGIARSELGLIGHKRVRADRTLFHVHLQFET